MRLGLQAIGLVLASLVMTRAAMAAPKHDICADLGGSLAFGISSYGSADGWPEKAEANGVPWKFLYYYVFPSQDTDANVSGFIAAKAQIARGLNAMMVVTFYDLLKRGTSAGLTARPGAADNEADVVEQVLADASLMKGYYDGLVVVLEAAATSGVPTLVHVEPDSWGFMMWAMGVEGRKDPTSVPVKVVSSGQSDLAGQSFSEDAAGFGKALLYLRDKYAPGVRMGWHASNFRAGAGGDVVAAFYSGMGQWDAILTEDPHILSDAANWWLPLASASVDANVGWFRTVSQAAHLPILMWQIPIGPFDFHFFGEGAPGLAVLSRFEDAGLVGMMWEQQGGGDPDTFRGIGLSTPPSSSPAGGTALDLRTRLAAYSATRPGFLGGSPCARGAATPTDGGAGAAEAGSGDGGTRGTGASSGASGASGAGQSSSGQGGAGGSGVVPVGGGGSSGAGVPAATPSADSGCGCRLVANEMPAPAERAASIVAALAFFFRRRRRVPRAALRVGGARSDRLHQRDSSTTREYLD